jgi:hypothetical protein
MYSQTDNAAVQARLKTTILESERNIEYLGKRLQELELKARPPKGGPPLPPKDFRNNRSGGWQQPTSGKQYTKLGREHTREDG